MVYEAVHAKAAARWHRRARAHEGLYLLLLVAGRLKSARDRLAQRRKLRRIEMRMPSGQERIAPSRQGHPRAVAVAVTTVAMKLRIVSSLAQNGLSRANARVSDDRQRRRGRSAGGHPISI